LSDRWKNYFDSHGAFGTNWLTTAVPHWSFHETLYGMIQKHSPANARILGVGSGPGWSEFYLSALGYQVTGVDNEPTLVDLANNRSKILGVPANFETADAFDLSKFHSKFDLAFSCGVLEHFDREVTVQLLQEQALCAKKVLIQIPAIYTKYTGEITDERIYSINQLAQIVEDAGLKVVEKFGYGDLTATRTHVLLRRLLPRAIWRMAQNMGYAYSLAVIGERPDH
jgi:SAM-dependent methyltransferase